MKKSYLKSSMREIRTIVDSETGEVLDTQVTSHKYLANNKEEFFLCYVTLLSVFKEISGPAIKVYASLLYTYKPGMPIAITVGLKKILSAEIGVKSPGTISNVLLELLESKLLYKKDDVRGIYYINPRYAFKGSSSERDKTLKAVIELECRDC